jgi:hypothetical protein
MIAKMRFTFTLIVLMLTGHGVAVAGGAISEEDKKILSLVLKEPLVDGEYTVVARETGLGFSSEKKFLKYVEGQLKTNRVYKAGMLDELINHNKSKVTLTIPSSEKDGYVIDTEGKYENYFSSDKSGGWKKWYEDHPKARGMTTVSLPMYDKKRGLVLVYKGWQAHYLEGDGEVILYKYNKGELKKIGEVNVWVS